jgi:hypothetical protein
LAVLEFELRALAIPPVYYFILFFFVLFAQAGLDHASFYTPSFSTSFP